MKRFEILFAALFLAAGVGYESIALRMPQGKVAYPGPGYFPALVGAFLVLTAAACLVQACLKAGPAPAGARAGAATTVGTAGGGQVVRTWLLLAFLVLYVLALTPLGFPLAILGFLVAAIAIFGYRRWLPALGIAAVLTALSYFAFVVWLKVPLPLGILADLLD